MARKYSFEFKHKVVDHYLSGKDTSIRTAEKFDIPVGNLDRWVYLYRLKGLEGLKPHKSRVFTGDFKCHVIEYMTANRLSCGQAERHFDITHSKVRDWAKIYREKGREGLLGDNRTDDMAKKITNNEKADGDKTHAELLNELQYLRMENAYLKKLRALTERQKLAQELKPKSSKN